MLVHSLFYVHAFCPILASMAFWRKDLLSFHLPYMVAGGMFWGILSSICVHTEFQLFGFYRYFSLRMSSRTFGLFLNPIRTFLVVELGKTTFWIVCASMLAQTIQNVVQEVIDIPLCMFEG